jgi:hypothetical protein
MMNRPIQRQLMPRLLMMLAASVLMGCAAGPQPMPDLSVTKPVPVPPPPNLLTPPPTLPPPRSGQLTELEANHREVARLYHQLASQMCQLLQYLQAPTEGCPAMLHPQTTALEPR